MTQPHRVGDLEITQDLELHRRELKVERAGWVLMLLIILAALLGLFGSGPLSKGNAQSVDGLLNAEYDRFARFVAPAELSLTLQPGAVQGGQLRVWLSREFLQQVQLQKITPEPDSVQAEGNHLTYTFKAVKGEQPLKIVFQLQTQAIGLLRGSAGLAGTAGTAGNVPEVNFRSFVYP